jgi:hypothetical protein
MSAASFLGIAGLVAISGFDGLIYSIGFLVGWPIVTFLIAELNQLPSKPVQHLNQLPSKPVQHLNQLQREPVQHLNQL